MRSVPRVVALLLAVGVAGCGVEAGSGAAPAAEAAPVLAPPAPDAPPPLVLLVTLDTTRADRLGCYGYAPGHTPRFDALARSGLTFDRAYAPAPITLPSHASMLTGVDPARHGARDNGIYRLTPDALLLSEVLSGEGFRTGAFVASYVLEPSAGLAQGFERYDGVDVSRLGSEPTLVDRPADEVVSAALAWIGGLDRQEPGFVWVHLFDPHQPVRPPLRFRQFVEDPYDGAIAFMDEQVGRLLDFAEQRERGPSLHVIVAGDHGEAFGEHGEASHGLLLHDATMRVPLILASPRLAGVRGRRVDAPVSLTDIPQTILQLLDLPADRLPHATAPSLLASAGLPGSGRDVLLGDERPILLETIMPWHSHRWHPLEGVVWQGHKLVDGRHPELYALADDPDETTDLADRRPDLVERLRAARREAVAHAAALEWTEQPELSHEDRERLAALGYTSSAASLDQVGDRSLPDPREHIGDLATKDEAIALIAEARALIVAPGAGPGGAPQSVAERRRAVAEKLETARALLEGILARNPDDPTAIANLGLAHLTAERWAEAVPLFERHELTNPGLAVNSFCLGLCYEGLGDPARARAAVHEALAREPRFGMALEWIVNDHAARGEAGHVVGWLERALSTSRNEAERRRLQERLVGWRTRMETAGQVPVAPRLPAAR